jgi:hypothetical protein
LQRRCLHCGRSAAGLEGFDEVFRLCAECSPDEDDEEEDEGGDDVEELEFEEVEGYEDEDGAQATVVSISM